MNTTRTANASGEGTCIVSRSDEGDFRFKIFVAYTIVLYLIFAWTNYQIYLTNSRLINQISAAHLKYMDEMKRIDDQYIRKINELHERELKNLSEFYNDRIK